MTSRQLQRVLDALDLTQQGLADTLGVSPVTVWKWCHGRLAVPRYVTAYLDLLEAHRAAA